MKEKKECFDTKRMRVTWLPPFDIFLSSEKEEFEIFFEHKKGQTP
jgi:hypothetical protein